MISFAIADAAVEAGAVLACGTEVAEIVPGEGVRLAGGDFLRAPTVVSNADPKRALAMLGDSDAVPDAYRQRLDRLAGAQPGREVQRRAAPAADVPGRRRGERGRTRA